MIWLTMLLITGFWWCMQSKLSIRRRSKILRFYGSKFLVETAAPQKISSYEFWLFWSHYKAPNETHGIYTTGCLKKNSWGFLGKNWWYFEPHSQKDIFSIITHIIYIACSNIIKSNSSDIYIESSKKK